MSQILGTILMVLTSCGEMDDGKPTGLWLEEFSVPYQLFVEAGYEVKLVSLTGGQVPVDARSLNASNPPEQVKALALLQDVGKLSETDPAAFGAVFFPGGHGTMFDMPDSDRIQTLVRAFVESGKPSAFVCHGPAALVGVMGSNGHPLVRGKKVTGFTNDEEDAVELTEAMPFLLETRLRSLGAEFVGAPNFQAHTIVDGNLITGQNPPSSQGAAQALVDQLRQRGPAAGKPVPAAWGSMGKLHAVGDVYLAGQPHAGDFEEAGKQGVKTVINLRHPDEIKGFDEEAEVTRQGLKYLNPAWNGPEELTDEIFEELRTLLKKAERPVLLHCGSANRVGAVWLPYRVLDQGVPYTQALQEAKTIGLKTPEYEIRAEDYIKRQKK